MVESSDQMWSTGEGKGKPLQYSCLENPMNSMNDNDKLRGIIKADSLTTTQELVEELNIDHSMVI